MILICYWLFIFSLLLLAYVRSFPSPRPGFVHQTPVVSAFHNAPKSTGTRLLLSSHLDPETDRLAYIQRISQECVSISLERFRTTNNENSKDQMGTWIDRPSLDRVIQALNRTRLEENSPIFNSLRSSFVPMMVPLFPSVNPADQSVELNLFFIPRNSTMPARRHTAGTILLYMGVVGGNVRSFMSTGMEIGVESLQNNIVMRLGGPTRVFESDARSFAIIFEMAIKPPRNDQSMESNGSGQDGFIDLEHRVIKLDISSDDARSLIGGLPESQLGLLSRLSLECVNISTSQKKQELYDASSSSSNSPSMVGSWLDQDSLENVIGVFNRTGINTASTFCKSMEDILVPVQIPLLQENGVELNAFQIPSNFSLPSRKHPAGTVIYYLSSQGSSVSISSWNARDTVCLATDHLLNGEVLVRLGGPGRVFSNDGTFKGGKPSMLLELAFLPKKGSEMDYAVEGFGERINEVMRMSTSFEDTYDFLIDRFALWGEKGREETLANVNKIGFDDRLAHMVGGLDEEIKEIRRRVLLSRQLDQKTMDSLGIMHVKGVLLYGPPGTGKTLLAREIGKVLNAREPKVVNGPELLDKFVGEAERNVRLLFKDAEDEYAAVGTQSALHVVIFDEFDAIGKKRGMMIGDGSGVRDSVVNQLLSKMDGIGQLDNILIVGITNRKDLIDEALLRPGRFEVHLEIKAPSVAGRRDILAIMLRPMCQGGLLDIEIACSQITKLAEITDGWSGADLSGLVRSAVGFSLERCMNDDDEAFIDRCDVDMQVTAEDLVKGYEEMRETKKVPILSKGIRGRIIDSIRTRFKLYKIRASDDSDSVSLDDIKASIKTVLMKKMQREITNQSDSRSRQVDKNERDQD